MKKTLGLLIAVLVAAMIVAGFAPAPQETLTVAARGGTHVDVMNAVKADFEKENNCTVNILGLESADLQQKIALDAANSTGEFDVIMSDDPWITELAESGVLADLTKMGYTADPDFTPLSIKVGQYPYGEGDIYALPFSGNVMLFFYNKDVFQKLGFDVPTDWQTVLADAKAAKAAGYIGYVIRGQQGNPIVTDYLPILWSYGGNVVDKDMNVTINSKEAADALDLYKELLANGANYEKNDIVAAVADGKAAMSLGWPSWYISGNTSKAAYAPIPGKVSPDAKANGSGMLGNWLMGVTANSKNKELALKFLEYVTSADAQKKGADVGGVPTRTSVLSDPDLVAKFPHYPALLDAMNNSVVRPRTPLWSAMETALGVELSNAISGTKSTADALKDAADAITKIIAEG